MKKHYYLLIVGLLFFALPSFTNAAIDIDSSSSASTGASDANSLIWAHTTSGSDRVLIVGVSIQGDTSVSSVTYGDEALTLIDTERQGNGTGSSLWYMTAPQTGTNDVVVTLGNPARFVAGASSYTGVDQTNTIRSFNTARDKSGTTASVEVSSAVDDMVVDVVAKRGDLTTNPISAGVGQTQRWNQRTTLDNNSNGMTGVSSDKPGSALTTMGWTWADSREWVIIGASLRPAPDTTAPGAITDLNVLNITQTSVDLLWTAPGDDNDIGTAASYDIRYSTSTITEGNFADATSVLAPPTPAEQGTSESYAVVDLSADTEYYFAIKATDEAGNTSPLSNVPNATTQGTDLFVSLSAFPTSGQEPLSGVDLTAQVSGNATGTIAYTFYCNRDDEDTNVTEPFDAQFTDVAEESQSVLALCDYEESGTYIAKVIVERESLFTQNRVEITVTDSETPPVDNPSPGGGGSRRDTRPPLQPTEFTLNVLPNGSRSFTWQNPTDTDFARVAIVRKEGSAPNSVEDGKTIYENNGMQFIDTDRLDPESIYFYSIYAYDRRPNYAHPVIIFYDSGEQESNVVEEPGIVLRAGDLVASLSENNPDVYIINEFGYKRLILNPQIFEFYGHLSWSAIKNVPSTSLRAYRTANLYRNCESGDPRIWALGPTTEDTSVLHWVNMSAGSVLTGDSEFFQKVFCINNSEFSWYEIGQDYTSLQQIPVYSRE